MCRRASLGHEAHGRKSPLTPLCQRGESGAPGQRILMDVISGTHPGMCPSFLTPHSTKVATDPKPANLLVCGYLIVSAPLTGGAVKRAAFGDEASEKGLTPTRARKSGLLIHLMSLLEPPWGSIRGTKIPNSRSSVANGFFKHILHRAVQPLNPSL